MADDQEIGPQQRTVDVIPPASDAQTFGGAPAPASPSVSGLPDNRQLPASPAAAAIGPHKSALGHVSDFIMGHSTSYEPQPDGSVKEVTQKQPPGQFFRGLLLAGILGGAAGASKPDFAQGFGAGVEKETDTLQKRDQQQHERAQQTAAAQQNQAKLNQDKQRQQVEIDHMHLADLQAIDAFHANNMATVDSRNAANDKMEQAIVAQGGKPSQVMVDGQDVNGQFDNGEKMHQFLMKNPQYLHQAPEGQHRIQVDKIDTEGLTKGKYGEWVDEKTGQDVDIHDRTRHTFYDVPDSIWDKRISVKGDDVSTWFKTDPSKLGISGDQDLNMSFGEMVGIRQKLALDSVEQAKVELEKAQARRADRAVSADDAKEKRLQLASVRDNYGSQEKDAQKDLDELFKQKKDNEFNPAKQAEIDAQIDQAKKIRDAATAQRAKLDNQIAGLKDAVADNPKPSGKQTTPAGPAGPKPAPGEKGSGIQLGPVDVSAFTQSAGGMGGVQTKLPGVDPFKTKEYVDKLNDMPTSPERTKYINDLSISEDAKKVLRKGALKGAAVAEAPKTTNQMVGPDGRIILVPDDDLDGALAAGWTVVPASKTPAKK